MSQWHPNKKKRVSEFTVCFCGTVFIPKVYVGLGKLLWEGTVMFLYTSVEASLSSEPER